MITDMSQGRPAAILWRFTIPMLLSAVFQQLYNVADSVVAGRFVGEDALAAVGASFPITMIFMAVALGSNTGCSVIISQLFGAKETARMKTAVSTSVIAILALSALLTAGGFLFCEPLMRLLGSTDTILPEAEAYAVPILLAAPFHCSSLALAQCLRAEGKSKESMAGQLAGGLLSIVLDPLFIYTLGMGIRGAGAATALSQVMVWAALLWFYVRGKTSVRISVRQVARTPRMVKLIFTTGFPSAVTAATRWPPSCSTAQRAALETLPSPRSASHPASRGWRSPCPSALCRGFSPWRATPTAAKTTRG